jgi:hypothetical protein
MPILENNISINEDDCNVSVIVKAVKRENNNVLFMERSIHIFS